MSQEPRIKFSESINSMTIRDYFAGQALVAMYQDATNNHDLGIEEIASDAYFIADKMLKARNQ